MARFSIDNNKKERFCFGTVFQTGIGIYFFNPETSSRVTLASLGIDFQPKLKTCIIINKQKTKIISNHQVPHSILRKEWGTCIYVIVTGLLDLCTCYGVLLTALNDYNLTVLNLLDSLACLCSLFLYICDA